MKRSAVHTLAAMLPAIALAAASCRAPLAYSGRTAQLALDIELSADFTSVSAGNPGARFLLPEMGSLDIRVDSLDPFTVVSIRQSVAVSFDPAIGWVRAKALVGGIPVNTPVSIVVSGKNAGGTVISRAMAETTIPEDAVPPPLTLVLMPTAAFPGMVTLAPGSASSAQTVPARSSIVCTFVPAALVNLPAFASWSYPQAPALQVSLRLADGTRIPLAAKADGSGVTFDTPYSAEHYFIVYNPGDAPAKLGALLVALTGTAPIVPTVTLNDITRNVGDPPFYLNPTSPSGGAFAYSSSDPLVATVNAATGLVAIAGVGTTTISVNQAAWGFYDASSVPGSAVLTVNAGGSVSPTIGTFTIPTQTYLPGGVYDLSPPSSNSPGAFTFSCDNSAVATVSGTTLNIIGAGTAQITASQAPAGAYLAGSVSATLTVNKGTPLLLGFADATTTTLSANFSHAATVDPSTPSTGALGYSVLAGSSVSVDALTGEVSVLAAGATTLRASLSADANYLAVTRDCVITVDKVATSIAGLSALNATYGDAPFSIGSPSSLNTNPFGYSSDNPAVATVDGFGQVSVTGAGSANLTVSQPEDAVYQATSQSVSITVSKASVAISLSSPVPQPFSAGTYLLSPTSNNTDTSAFSFVSADPLTAAVNPVTGLVTFVKTGSVIITISQAETANFYAPTPHPANMMIQPVLGTVTTTAASNLTTTSADTGGNVTYTGGDPTVARGVCWSTSPNPTTADFKLAAGTGGLGPFPLTITGLSAGTTYYLRAYLTNGAGDSYGAEETFTTLP